MGNFMEQLGFATSHLVSSIERATTDIRRYFSTNADWRVARHQDGRYFLDHDTMLISKIRQNGGFDTHIDIIESDLTYRQATVLAKELTDFSKVMDS